MAGLVLKFIENIFVWLISSRILKRREKREYLQKIETVNKEVLYALRSGIPEKHFPSDEIITSLINSTSRRYKVDIKDVHKPIELVEELIKEIMDSSFISIVTKREYCDILENNFSLIQKEKDEIIEMNEQAYRLNSKYRAATQLSASLGIMVGVLIMAFGIIGILEVGDMTELFTPTIITSATIISALVSIMNSKTWKTNHRNGYSYRINTKNNKKI
jgi:hypothetical protein